MQFQSRALPLRTALELLKPPALFPLAQLQVEENARPTTLTFVSCDAAKKFARFCELYIAESGAGNGYSAYWYQHGKYWGVDNPPRKISASNATESQIDIELIEQMAFSIHNARTGRSSDREPYIPVARVIEGLIDFEFDERKLPARITPGNLDYIRVIEPGYPDDSGEDAFRRDFRVIGISGSWLIVIAENIDQAPAGDSFIVPISAAMKIHDYHAEMKQRRSAGAEG